MKEHLIFLTLLTLVLAGCVSDEKIQNESGQEIDTFAETTNPPVPAGDMTTGEKADIEGSPVISSDDSKKSENSASLEKAIANEDLRDRINKELEEAAKKRDAQTTTLPTMPPTSSTTQAEMIDEPITDSSIKVEVYHFHGISQCVSCITVGAYAEETVNTYFSQELKDGRLVFAHVNYDLPENKALATKYGVTGSSLWIGTYTDGKFSKEENVNVWYKINSKGDYLSYLKEVISAKLA
jgi:PBP1b-binding outer membrane lipoprotein LpoB